MKAVLANPKRLKKVKEIHSGIKKLYKGLSLEEVMIVGFNWKRDKIDKVLNEHKELKEFFYKWDYNGDDYSLNSFRLYDQPAITRHARYRAVFLQNMRKMGYSLNNLSMEQLEEISCHSIGYATVTYAIKCYLIANYSKEEINSYQGIQSQTGPVINAVEKLYGTRMSNYSHTMLCNKLSNEIGISPTDINTSFYTMG